MAAETPPVGSLAAPVGPLVLWTAVATGEVAETTGWTVVAVAVAVEVAVAVTLGFDCGRRAVERT